MGQVNVGVVPLYFWVKHIQYGKEYGSTSYFVEKALLTDLTVVIRYMPVLQVSAKNLFLCDWESDSTLIVEKDDWFTYQISTGLRT